MSAEEAREFEASPYCRSAVRLRRWDEEAKDPEAEVADLSSYRQMLGRLAAA
jgi:gamma-butyrobetaine dioxygenase